MSFYYLDANATTAQSAEVADAVLRVAALGPLNASSAHSGGDAARRILADARDAVCDALSADDPDNVVFTSSGTEANNIVVNGFRAISGARVVVSAVEHASVAEPATGSAVVPVKSDGSLDLERLSVAVDAHGAGPVLVCVQAANSETGVVQPLEHIKALLAARPGTYLHVDAAQALGRIALTADMADAISFSGHKLHAPIGTGFLYMSDEMFDFLPRTVLGGGQERGFRSGTQNVAGIAGLAAALRTRFSDFDAHVRRMALMRDAFEAVVLGEAGDAAVVAAASPRLPNTSNIMFPGREGLAMMAALDEAGVVCSNGSACSSMKPSASAVLRAMGMTEDEAFSCLRFSFSVQNEDSDAENAARIVADVAKRMKVIK